MILLHVDEERTGDRILAIGNGLKGRSLAVHEGGLNLVGILIQEGVETKKMPRLLGLASSFCTMRLSFSLAFGE